MDNDVKIFKEIDKPRSNCGIFGIYNHPQASIMSYYALHALQHRGQEAAGITTFYYDEAKKALRYAYTRGEGLVLDVFSDPKILTETLKGKMAIGHNRYSTTGSSSRANIQPFNMRYHNGILSVAHNGNLSNTKELYKKLQNKGTIFQTTTDTEFFLHLIAQSKETNTVDQIKDALQITQGSYSLVILTKEGLVAARDPMGIRPLSIGRIKVGDEYSYVVASETCAFDIIGAEYIRSVEHNELVVINDETVKTGKIESHKITEQTPEAKHCVFEYIYFSRPDSKIFGQNVDKVRRKLGKNLAVEGPVYSTDGEKITAFAVPDSGNTATLGFSRVNNVKNGPTAFEIGLIRSHYIGRTFIAPGQESREFKVKAKFNTVKGVIENRNVVVVDDSIVRGTTSKALIKLIWEAKPKEVHLRITSPPIKHPCYYGMDFPYKEELIANDYENEDEIGKALGCDTLHYLTKEKLLESVPQAEGISYCTACFDGEYPVKIDKNLSKESIEQ